MSLIHWWPLIENKLDKITGLELISTSSTFVEGKIGKALQLNGKIAKTTNPFIGLNDWSISFWLRDDGSSAWNDFICFSKNLMRLELDGASNWRWYYGQSNESYPETGNLFSSGTVIYSGAAANTWYHIAIIKKGANAQLYINSLLKTSTTSAINFTDESAMMYFNSRAIETTYGKISLNDIRCYDHALSYAEVKELSKALLVHYSFNDGFTSNICNWRDSSLCKMAGWGGGVAYNDGILTLTATNGWRAFMWDIGSNNIGSPITFSFEYKVIDISNAGYIYVQNRSSVAYGSSSGTLNLKQTDWKKETFTFSTATQYIGFNVRGLDSTGLNLIMQVRNIKIALNNFDDRYSEYNIDYEIPDESGYDHPTVLANKCEFVTDTNSGTLALHTPSGIDTAGSYLRADMKTLITPTAFTVSMLAKVNAWGVQTSGMLSFTDIISENYLASTFVQYDSKFRLNNSANTNQSSISSEIISLGSWHHYAFTWDGANLKGYKDGALYSSVAAAFIPDPFQYIFLGIDKAGGALRDADVTWSNFKVYMTALSAEDIEVESKTCALITDKGDIETHQFIEKTTNIITEAEFAIPAKNTVGNGKIEIRNEVMAYGLQANTYYYSGDPESSNAIFKGKFKPNTQYYFDLFMDVDSMWWEGISNYVPGGFVVRYTDGTTVEVTARSTNGANGWQRVQFYSDPTKTIYGLGIYYYTGARWYLRHDSGIYEIDKDNAQITSKYTVETTQITETSFENNALIHSSGNIVGREIIEI